MITDLQKRITELKKATGTAVLAHSYQAREIVEIADITGKIGRKNGGDTTKSGRKNGNDTVESGKITEKDGNAGEVISAADTRRTSRRARG